MEISQTTIGDWLELRIKGRLDGYWSDHFAATLDDLVRKGTHQIRVQMAEIAFLSSAGIRVILKYYKQLQSIGGGLIISEPSEAVRKVLELSGLKMLLGPPASIGGTPIADKAPPGKGTMIQRPTVTLEVFETAPGARLKCRLAGDPSLLSSCLYRAENCQTMQFPATTFGVGLGALGHDFEDCQDRFGEFLAVAGAAAYLPTDGTNVADYLMASGSAAPEVEVCYALVCDGSFAHHVRFEAKAEARSVSLTELVSACLDQAKCDMIGLVMVAETMGLMGAALRRSPALGEGNASLFEFPEVRQWLSFTAERAFSRSLALLVGVAQREPTNGAAGKVLRPLGAEARPVGHFHAAAFSFRPLPRGPIELQASVAPLFESQNLLGILHLIADNRDVSGVGQSEFVRGACWFGPIAEISQ